MVVGSVFTIAIEIAGVASLFGRVSQYFSSSSTTSPFTPSDADTSTSTSNPEVDYGKSADQIRRDEDYEFYRKKRMEREKEEKDAEVREEQERMEAKRQQELEEAHEKIAAPEWQ